MRAILAPCGSLGGQAAVADALNLTKLRVVVIDDNAFSRHVLHFALGALGIHQISATDNATDGLMTARSIMPDLVLVDWMMPSVDGMQFLTGVRGDKMSQIRAVPIIMVTAYSEIWRVHEARDAGANEFVVKPFSARTLFGKIRTLVDTPRPYIDIPDGYFGPDRRRRAQAVPKDRRRQTQAAPAER
jgi:two-component system, chemotaxis family, chemotaxis protein CheY